MSKKILVTGGAGFIGSALVRHLIAGPDEFIQTNVVGTSNLLEAARAFYSRLPGEKNKIGGLEEIGWWRKSGIH